VAGVRDVTHQTAADFSDANLRIDPYRLTSLRTREVPLRTVSHDPSRELASGFGFAFGRSFTRKVAAMIELRTESSIDFQRDRLVLVNAGIIDGVRNVVVYANIGHSVFSDDGGHFYAGGGFKVVIGR
jgi:hypothetical protein